MHTFKTVGIVIVDFHGFDQTITLLESLAKQKPPGEFKIYLVIADTTLQEATKQMQQFKSSVKLSNIAYLPIKNNGFSANNNTGIKEALRDGCDAVLMINNRNCSSQQINISRSMDWQSFVQKSISHLEKSFIMSLTPQKKEEKCSGMEVEL